MNPSIRRTALIVVALGIIAVSPTEASRVRYTIWQLLERADVIWIVTVEEMSPHEATLSFKEVLEGDAPEENLVTLALPTVQGGVAPPPGPENRPWLPHTKVDRCGLRIGGKFLILGVWMEDGRLFPLGNEQSVFELTDTSRTQTLEAFHTLLDIAPLEGPGRADAVLAAAETDNDLLAQALSLELASLRNADNRDPYTARLVELLNEDHPAIQRGALTGLQGQLTPEAVERIKALALGDDNTVGRYAISTLSEYGTPEAMAGIIAATKHDHADRRTAACWGLNSFNADEASNAQIALLTDEDHGVRAAAARCLGVRLADQDFLEAIPLLVALLDDYSAFVSDAAASSLGSGPPERVLDPLLAEVRRAIENSKPPADVFTPLHRIYREADESIRTQIAAEFDVFLAVLNGPGPRHSREIINLLREIDKARALNEIASLIDDENPKIRARTCTYLSFFGETEARDVIVHYLDDSNPSVRSTALRAVYETFPQSAFQAAVPKIRQLLDDPASVVRGSAIEALGRWRSPEAADLLIEQLSADEREHTRQVLRSLVLLTSVEGVYEKLVDRSDLVIGILNDRERDVTTWTNAADLLWRIGTTKADAALREAAESHPNEHVRNFAQRLID